MPQMSPTLEGFRAIFRRPSLGFAEISWRWAFGSAGIVLSVLSFFEYLDTLPLTHGDLILLKSKQPALVSRAIQHTLAGSAMRVLIAFIVLFAALSAGWIFLAAFGRSATLRGVLRYFREREQDLTRQNDTAKGSIGSLMALNFFRLAAVVAAALGCVSAFVIANLVSSTRHPEPELAALIIMTIPVGVWLAWSGINWYLSLAAIFVVAGAQDTFSALASAVDLCRDRTGAVFVIGTWFGLAHLGIFMVASIAVALPLGLLTVLPVRLIVLCIFVLTLAYFAIADFLYMGRLAAYVAMLESPPPAMLTLITRDPSNQRSAVGIQPSGAIDRDEVILSDIPDAHDQ